MTVDRRSFLLAALLGGSGCLGLVGCKPSPAAKKGRVERVISLSPSTTEALYAIGAGALLVGRSEHCDHPSEALALPSVGGYANPNLEAVLALRPQVVVGSQSPAGPRLADTLQGHGIETLFPPTRSVNEIVAMMHVLGARFALADGAERATRRLERELDRVKRWATERPRPSVVMVFDPRPLFVAGPGSFADELIALAGGTNRITTGGQWPTIDEERLLALDPEVIVDATMAGDQASQLPSLPGWEPLRAVREGRVRRLLSDTALRPGPRLGEGLRALATAIHGESPP